MRQDESHGHDRFEFHVGSGRRVLLLLPPSLTRADKAHIVKMVQLLVECTIEAKDDLGEKPPSKP